MSACVLCTSKASKASKQLERREVGLKLLCSKASKASKQLERLHVLGIHILRGYAYFVLVEQVLYATN